MRDSFAINEMLIDVLANLLPGYSGLPIELFRGERGSNHQSRTYGVSWTTDQHTAKMFARGLNRCPQTGRVLPRTVAPARAILSAPNIHSQCFGEAGYVVDRRGLDRANLIKSYDPAGKAAPWLGRAVSVDIALHIERPFFSVLAPTERLGHITGLAADLDAPVSGCQLSEGRHACAQVQTCAISSSLDCTRSLFIPLRE